MWNPFAQRGESIPPTEEARVGIDGGESSPLTGIADSTIADVNLMGNVAVATLTVTELTQDAGAEQLAELLQLMRETGAGNFVLDVQNVQFMDTTCLGCLVEAMNGLAATGGQIALASPNHSVHYVFRLTRLDRVFRICGSVMAAMDAVEGRADAE